MRLLNLNVRRVHKRRRRVEGVSWLRLIATAAPNVQRKIFLLRLLAITPRTAIAVAPDYNRPMQNLIIRLSMWSRVNFDASAALEVECLRSGVVV